VAWLAMHGGEIKQPFRFIAFKFDRLSHIAFDEFTSNWERLAWRPDIGDNNLIKSP